MKQSGKAGAQTVTGRLRAWLAPAALLLLAGCSGGKGEVTGEVTYKGEPLPFGRITFVSDVGYHQTASSFIIRGKYKIVSIPAGPARIEIESLKPPTKEQIEKAQKESESGSGPSTSPELLKELAEGPPLKYVKIPPKYGNAEKSGETYTVEKGSQTHNITLKD